MRFCPECGACSTAEANCHCGYEGDLLPYDGTQHATLDHRLKAGKEVSDDRT